MYAREVAQDPNMSLAAHLRANFFPEYPGFEGVSVGLEGHIHDTMREAVAQRLTQALDLIVEDLVDETQYAISTVLGSSEEWQSIRPGLCIRELVPRITGRVLVGKRLCRNDQWLHISKEYTASSGHACASLTALPAFFRPIGHWVLPSCRTLRALVREATAQIGNEIKARRMAQDKVHTRSCPRACKLILIKDPYRPRVLVTPKLQAATRLHGCVKNQALVDAGLTPQTSWPSNSVCRLLRTILRPKRYYTHSTICVHIQMS